jgi:enamine deaminase RidA (YjgF/YER057c/UK114 family)
MLLSVRKVLAGVVCFVSTETLLPLISLDTFSTSIDFYKAKTPSSEVVYLEEGVKQGLGLIYYGGQLVEWGVGAKVIQPAGFVFLSGVEGRDPETNRPVEGVRAQTRLALDKIKDRLGKAGTSIENVVKFVWYVARRDDKDEFIRSRDEWLAENAPKLLKERSYASTLLLDVGLALPDMLVEIDATAVIPQNPQSS